MFNIAVIGNRNQSTTSDYKNHLLLSNFNKKEMFLNNFLPFWICVVNSTFIIASVAVAVAVFFGLSG